MEKKLGEPDLKIMGLSMWVHNREFENAQDADDGNWLNVTAHCQAPGASVWAQGAIVMVTDILSFRDQCAAMRAGSSTSATMESHEPNLKVALQAMDSMGHIGVRVEISPEHDSQFHRIDFEYDQSYLPNIIRELAAIVEKFPVRGVRHM